MTPTEIARELLASLSAPRGSVSILTEPEVKTGFALRVWVTANAPVDKIPAEYFGHPVIVQPAPKFVAQAC